MSGQEGKHSALRSGENYANYSYVNEILAALAVRNKDKLFCYNL